MNNKYNQKYLIEIGIGLQAVDGLEGSKYFSEQTKRYINGEISIKELQDLISDYYKSKPDEFIKTGESDTVAIKIAELLSDDSFSFLLGNSFPSIDHFLVMYIITQGNYESITLLKVSGFLMGSQ